MTAALRNRTWLLLLMLVLLAAVAAVESVQAGLAQRFARPDAPTDLSRMYLIRLTHWWTLGLLGFAAALFANRYPIQPRRLRRTVPPHIIGSLLFIAGAVATLAASRYFLLGGIGTSFGFFFLNRLSLYFATYLLYYWAIIVVCSALRYHALLREQAIIEARLDGELTQARLRALQAQLQPHLLFNTLNAICGYATQRREEPVIAMISNLREVLRSVLRNQPERSITLREEMELVRAYLDLHCLRLGEKLRVEYEIDERALDAAVPPLLLQPLVENALQHGVGVRGEGAVTVSVRRTNGSVQLQVRDTGPGFPSSAQSTGLGISATAQRLQLFYGAGATLDTSAAGRAGAEVRLEIPHRSQAN